MRATWISMLAVLVVAVGVCAVAMTYVHDTEREADALRNEILTCVAENRLDEADERLVELSEYWRKRRTVLEAFTPHEHLHSIEEYIIDADANLKVGDLDDFARSMSLLGEALEHLYEEERILWSNLF